MNQIYQNSDSRLTVACGCLFPQTSVSSKLATRVAEAGFEIETVGNIQQAHDRFKINTRDSHRADKKKKEKRQKKTMGKRDYVSSGKQ